MQMPVGNYNASFCPVRQTESQRKFSAASSRRRSGATFMPNVKESQVFGAVILFLKREYMPLAV
jgi:hypothetical protein